MLFAGGIFSDKSRTARNEMTAVASIPLRSNTCVSRDEGEVGERGEVRWR